MHLVSISSFILILIQAIENIFSFFASYQGWICQHEYLVMKNKSIVHILEFEKIIQFLGKNSLWSDKSCLPSFLHRPGQKVKAKIHIIICICNWTLSILTVNPFHFNQLDFLLENRFFIAIWYRFFSIYVDCRSTMENVTSFSGSINSIFCSNICTNPFIISTQSAETFFTQKMASHHRCRPNLFLLIATKNGFFLKNEFFWAFFTHNNQVISSGLERMALQQFLSKLVQCLISWKNQTTLRCKNLFSTDNSNFTI